MALSDLYMGDLLLKLMAHETGDIARVSFQPQKTFLPEGEDTQPFVCAVPESEGISSSFVSRLVTRLKEDPACRMHKLMILRNGVCIAREQFGPYPFDYWHVTHSMCKSLTGMAIGLLVADGLLDLEDNVFELFNHRQGFLDLLKPKDLTVRHLLTMTSGVQFNEAGVLTGDDWRRGFLTAPFKFTPGTAFEYNSMNSYMLSAIVTEKTGVSMVQFLEERLFRPMGFTRYLWESCPMGITKGGWGMYLRIEDMCKAGQLYLQEGTWQGRELIPRDWVRASVTKQADTSVTRNQDAAKDDYGYQIWISTDRPGAFTFNGMLGQNVYCYPDVQMVIATNAANDDVFQSGRMSAIIRQMMKEELEASMIRRMPLYSVIGGDKTLNSGSGFHRILRGGWRMRERRMAAGTGSARSAVVLKTVRGETDERSLQSSRSDHAVTPVREALLRALSGRTYDTGDTGIGILPLLIQVFRINFTKGIHAIGFEYDEDHVFSILLHEGDAVHRLVCNFTSDDSGSVIDVNGERFLLTVRSTLTVNGFHETTLSNELLFADESTRRILNLVFHDLPKHPGEITTPESFLVRMNEDPGSEMIIQSMKTVSGDKDSGSFNESMSYAEMLVDGTKALVKAGLKQLGAYETLRHSIEDTVAPSFKAVLRDA